MTDETTAAAHRNTVEQLVRLVTDEVIGRAEQECRYALKHQHFADCDEEFRSGWEVAAHVIEHGIRDHVYSHFGELMEKVRAHQSNDQVDDQKGARSAE